MAFDIIFAPEALENFRSFEGGVRMKIKKEIENHLRHEPSKISKSRIKRLKGLRQPEYRLRIDQIRIYYDINLNDSRIEILRILPKLQTYTYLEQEGLKDENTTTD